MGDSDALLLAASLEASSEHPLASAIVDQAQKAKLSLLPVADFAAVEGQGVKGGWSMAKKTFQRIKLNLFWALIYNLIGIPIAAGVLVGGGISLSSELAGLAMALSSVSVVTSSLMLNWVKIAGQAR